MSENDLSDIHNDLAALRKLVPWIKWLLGGVAFLLGGAFALGGWVAFLQFTVTEHQTKLDKQEHFATEVREWKASTSSNRFTSGDFVTAKANLDAQINGIDKRVTIIETKLEQINEAAQQAAAAANRNTDLLTQLLKKP